MNVQIDMDALALEIGRAILRAVLAESQARQLQDMANKVADKEGKQLTEKP